MNRQFDIRFNYEKGTVSSLKNPVDKDAMNWVEGTREWGMIKDAEVLSVEPTEKGIQAVYQTKHLRITVNREVCGDKYRESYCFENYHDFDVFFNRGAVGIYATFNDNYEPASICMTQKCHTHIWCGRNCSYVQAVKMGPCDFGLGLVLTQGSLDTYSVERDLSLISNDRGDFIFHPSVFNLRPGEKMVIEWELFWYKDREFCAAIADYDTVLLVETDNYTVYSDEVIEFAVNRPDVEVYLEDVKLPVTGNGGKTCVTYKPQRLGDHTFILKYGDRETITQFFVQIPFRELARKRAEFITQKQQFHRPGDSLDGAYLIYDNQDKCLVYDEIFSDYNASRERLVMGLFIAKYLQYDYDEKMYASLMKYYKFVAREFFDEESGAVYNAVGKNPARKRLYNAPWMSVFMLEMYHLTGDDVYLDRMFKLLCVYYEIGGERFYPNGLSMFETVEALKEAGKMKQAEELTAMYQKHVDTIIEIGISYPEHEVRYEQTIVTPAVTLIAQMYQITHDPKLIEECHKQLMILEKFNGRQPSHLMNDLAVRHWDGYWFGKRMLYGDTFPHSASIHSSDAFLHYYWISGDEEWKKRAVCGARNNLSVYRPDGSASCTRVHPLFVNGVRGEYYDEFANEQDGLLYFMIKFFGEGSYVASSSSIR